jgi:hypothetical protein
MQNGRTQRLARQPGQAWIDCVQSALDAQMEILVSGLRFWRELGRTTPGFARESSGTRVEQARPVALDALTVEQLDRLAAASTIDDYPRSGNKSEKLRALATANLGLDALTVDQLDRLAEASTVDGYPHGGTKRDKVAALEAALSRRDG